MSDDNPFVILLDPITRFSGHLDGALIGSFVRKTGLKKSNRFAYFLRQDEDLIEITLDISNDYVDMNNIKN